MSLIAVMVNVPVFVGVIEYGVELMPLTVELVVPFDHERVNGGVPDKFILTLGAVELLQYEPPPVIIYDGAGLAVIVTFAEYWHAVALGLS